MIVYNFTRVSRDQLYKIAQNAITSLVYDRDSDFFTLTLSVDNDSDVSIRDGRVRFEPPSESCL